MSVAVANLLGRGEEKRTTNFSVIPLTLTSSAHD